MKILNVIQESTAKKFSLFAGGTAIILAALTLSLYFKGAAAIILIDTAISVLCGLGIIRGNRLAAIILLICTLASRYDSYIASGGGGPNLLLSLLILGAYALGVIGTFARDRLRRMSTGEKEPAWIDPVLAASLKRIAGGVGIGFSIIVTGFAISAAGEFSLFNLLDSFLIFLFAWYTLKGRCWAAIMQVLLCVTSMLISFSRSGDLHALAGFIPLLFLETYLLGIVGVIKIRTGGTPQPLTVSRQSPIQGKAAAQSS